MSDLHPCRIYLHGGPAHDQYVVVHPPANRMFLRINVRALNGEHGAYQLNRWTQLFSTYVHVGQPSPTDTANDPASYVDLKRLAANANRKN